MSILFLVVKHLSAFKVFSTISTGERNTYGGLNQLSFIDVLTTWLTGCGKTKATDTSIEEHVPKFFGFFFLEESLALS